MSEDCDAVDAHAELWAKVRDALEGAGFDFDALVSRAAETLEQYRRNPWQGGALDAVDLAGGYEHQMHVGAWRIDAFNTAAGWRSVCERPSVDSAPAGARFGPFESRDRARRVALFHALWLDGLLTEDQAVAMLEGRAEVVEVGDERGDDCDGVVDGWSIETYAEGERWFGACTRLGATGRASAAAAVVGPFGSVGQAWLAAAQRARTLDAMLAPDLGPLWEPTRALAAREAQSETDDGFDEADR